MENNKNKQALSSVENALRILNSFSIDQTQKRVTDIAKELDIGKSTVSRLLSTLLHQGYVKKDIETQKFSLGTKILSLYSSLISNMDIIKEAKPLLEELASSTKESVQLAELDGSSVIYIDQIKSTYPMQIFAHIGRINPIHCTSSGRVLLAYKDEEYIDDILNQKLEKHTSSTITNKKLLKEELEKVKSLGYSLIENEFIEGIVSISAPIRDYKNNVIAAASLVGPIQRINGYKTKSHITKVQECAFNISSKMGYIKS